MGRFDSDREAAKNTSAPQWSAQCGVGNGSACCRVTGDGPLGEREIHPEDKELVLGATSPVSED